MWRCAHPPLLIAAPTHLPTMARPANPIAKGTTFTRGDTFPLRACAGLQLVLGVQLWNGEVVTIKDAWPGSSFISVIRSVTKTYDGDAFENAAKTLEMGEFPSATIRDGDPVFGIGNWSTFPMVWFLQDCSVSTAALQMRAGEPRFPIQSLIVKDVNDAQYVHTPRMPVWPVDPMERLEWLGRYMSWKLACVDEYAPQQCADMYVAVPFAKKAAYHRIRRAPMDEASARKIADEVAREVADHYGFLVRE